MSDSDIRLAGFIGDSITDGPGIRATIFVQGCLRHCPGCHNPETLPLEGGQRISADALYQKIASNPLVRGVTFSGGEPLLQARQLLPLAQQLRRNGYELAIYTGYTFEEILHTEGDALKLIALADTLIDGPFILAQRSLSLPFRGSKNQRILNIPNSLKAGIAIAETASRWNGSKQLCL